MTPSPLLWLYAWLLGAIIGSYLNVVIHRLPRGQSTVRPASRCPACGSRIRARDNLPVLSFLLLRGRCRCCGERISWRYPAVEAVNGFLFVACLLTFGLTADAVVAGLFSCLLLVLAIIDLDHYILPDRLTLPGLAVGLLVQPIWGRTSLSEALLGAVLGGGIILLLNGVWWLLRRVQGFGFGDVKMLAMIGCFLGPQGVVVSLFLATLTGSLAGLYFITRRQLDLQSKLPFGFFLAIGALVALFLGPDLIDRYLAFFP